MRFSHQGNARGDGREAKKTAAGRRPSFAPVSRHSPVHGPRRTRGGRSGEEELFWSVSPQHRSQAATMENNELTSRLVTSRGKHGGPGRHASDQRNRNINNNPRRDITIEIEKIKQGRGLGLNILRHPPSNPTPFTFLFSFLFIGLFMCYLFINHSFYSKDVAMSYVLERHQHSVTVELNLNQSCCRTANMFVRLVLHRRDFACFFLWFCLGEATGSLAHFFLRRKKRAKNEQNKKKI